MSNEQSTVTYSLEGILREIQSDLTEIKVSQARLEGEIKTLQSEVKSIREDVKELKSSSKAQIWTLIGILITAVTGFLVAVGRFVFFGNP